MLYRIILQVRSSAVANLYQNRLEDTIYNCIEFSLFINPTIFMEILQAEIGEK